MKTDTFLTLVKASGNIPTSQNTFEDSDILSFADEEIKSTITPLLIKTREDYLVKDVDSSLVANQQSYRIPKNAIGGKFRELSYVDSNGQVHDLIKVEIENLNQFNTTQTGSQPLYYWFKSNKVYLYPIPSTSSGSLRFSIYKRPSKLIVTTDACQINAIDTGTNTITVDSITNTSIVANAEIDMVMDDEPNDILTEASTISSVSGTDITFSSLPSDLAIGDWVSLSGYSPIIQIPEELTTLLIARVVLRIFQAQGNSEGIREIKNEIKEIKENLLVVLTPRVDGEPKKITSPNSIKRWV